MDKVSVLFAPSVGEIAGGLRAINSARPVVRILQRLSWAMIAIITALLIAGVIEPLPAIALLFVPGLCAFLLWSLPFYMAWMLRRNSPFWTNDIKIDFSPAGIRSTSAGAEGFTEWRAVIRTAETRRFFLYFTAAQSAQFLPKRALSTRDLDQLRFLFSEFAGKAGSPAASAPASALSPPVVQTSFQLDPRETARAAMVSVRKMGSMWIWYLLMIVIVSYNTMPTVYSQWRRGGFGAISIPLLLLGLSPLLMITIGQPLAMWSAAKRQVRSGPSFQGTQHVGVAEWGLQVSGPMSSGTLQWSAVMKAIETPEFFLFFLSKLHPVFIPKRLLNDADTTQVRRLTRSGLGSKAELQGDAGPIT